MAPKKRPLGKSVIVPVRMSVKEKARAKEKAKSLDITASEFLRRSANLSDVSPMEKQRSSKRQNNQSINWHLSRIGNNLNQLTYAINKARIMNKVDNALAKEIVRELMFFNIQINNQVEESR